MFALFGQNFFTPDVNNSFSIIAYAMETQAGAQPWGGAQAGAGNVETIELQRVDIDLMNQQGGWGGYFDGEHLFLNIALGVAGENIASVEFYTDIGFFAKQYIIREHGVIVFPTNNLSILTDSGNVALFGTDFEILGNRFTLRADDMNEDLLLFIGEEWDNATRPHNIDITAIATFNDGSSQSESINLVFAGRMGQIAGPVSDRVPLIPPDLTPTDPRELLEERIRWLEERSEEIPRELLERRTNQRPTQPPTPHNREAEQRPKRPEVPYYVLENRENFPRPVFPERNVSQAWEELTREELENRVMRFEMQGLEVPQELLDILAELD